MRAVCLKTHNFPTAPMALLARKVVPGIDIFGSIACNLEVGGINPSAVEAIINYEARQIGCPPSIRPIMPWSPALSASTAGASPSRAAFPITPATSGACSCSLRRRAGTGVHEVFRMVADADIILNLGHISFKEMTAIVPAARRQGVKRIVCDHPFFSHLSLPSSWSSPIRTYGSISPRASCCRGGGAFDRRFRRAIRNVGIARAVLSSDCGQLHNPPMVEALRITCQLLLEEEFTVEEIKVLLHHNPANLLYP